MRIFDAIILACGGIRRAPLRAALGTISFMVGIAAPVFVFGISEGMKEQIAELGTEDFRRKLSIYRSNDEESLFTPRLSDIEVIRDVDIEAQAIGGTQIWSNIPVDVRGQIYSSQVNGITNDTLQSLAQSPLIGSRNFPNFGMGATPCIINDHFLETIGSTSLPLELLVAGLRCMVIGLVSSEPYVSSSRNTVYLPIETARAQLQLIEERDYGGYGIFSNIYHNDSISRISILFQSYTDIEPAIDVIISAINDRRIDDRQYITERNVYFAEFDYNAFVETKNNLDRFLVTVMITVGSFVVLNVSLNSYYSARAREEDVAVQVALGAKSWEVVLITGLETIIYMTIGGVLGGILAILASQPFSQASDFRVVTDMTVLIKSFILLFLLGFLASVGPCWYVSRIDPSLALKK